MSERYLVVGLGNPGKDYANTRHNVGWWAVDVLARRHNISISKGERKALTGDGVIAGKRVLLAKPQTYMNVSGEAVRGLVDFYKVEPGAMMVMQDDLDLPIGALRIRAEGSHGGQNGMRSIIQHLNTNAVPRIKLGIGRPPGRMDAATYVLQGFKGDDEITMRIVVERAADAIEAWLNDGIERAMTRYNGIVS
ncbi:MAG: aminoacyl-tRNA hydrolase [Armatimonadetes bacterium]|nr:aminoacyl-tRNA hydrolase [Anaerolineae bacterium]